MASAKKCDVCGNFTDFNNDERIPNGITFTFFNSIGQAASTVEKYELCPDCLNKVRNILNKGE